jgi:hypothetical protein
MVFNRAQPDCDDLTPADYIEADLLAAFSLHPIGTDAYEHILKKASGHCSVVNRLFIEKIQIKTTRCGHISN